MLLSQSCIRENSLFDFLLRHSFHADDFFSRLLAAEKGDLARAKAQGLGEEFDQCGIGFSFDSRGAKTNLQNLAAAAIGGPAEDGVRASAGLYADGEARHKGVGTILAERWFEWVLKRQAADSCRMLACAFATV